MASSREMAPARKTAGGRGFRRGEPPGPLVELLNRAGKGASGPARLCRSIARELMEKLRLGDRELSLSLVTDRQIRRINREWAGHDAPTDVLTFPLHLERGSLGDVIVSLDTARRQAKDGGWTLEAELRRLLAHGLLHALGHTHDRGEDAARMAAQEERLLGRKGLVGAALTDGFLPGRGRDAAGARRAKKEQLARKAARAKVKPTAKAPSARAKK